MTVLRRLANRCIGAIPAWTPSSVLSMSAYLIVQVLGVLTSFATILLVARWGGSASQGVFFSYKILVDFLSACILFGFPQAFVFLLNKEQATVSGLTLFTLIYSALSVLIALIAIAIQLKSSLLPTTSVFAVAVLAVGVGGYVLHGLARGIILTRTVAGVFSLFSVAPALLLLLAIVILFLTRKFGFPIAIGAAGILSGLAGAIWLSGMSRPRVRELRELPFRGLVTQSLHTFVQSSLYAAQPVLTVVMFRSRLATDSDIGNFSIAITAFSAINVLVSVMAPVLFNRWSKSISWNQYATLARRTYWVAGALTVLAGIFMLAAHPIVESILGASYRAAVLPVQLMAFAVFPLLSTRFLSSAVHALGHPGVNSVSCFARLGAVAAFFSASYPLIGDLLAAGALSWVAGEWMAFLVQSWGAARARRSAVLVTQ